MPIPRFDISRHMVVLVVSSRNTNNALRVLHPPSRRYAAISISIAAVPNFLLSDRRRTRRRRPRTMLKTPITRTSRKVRRCHFLEALLAVQHGKIAETLQKCFVATLLLLLSLALQPSMGFGSSTILCPSAPSSNPHRLHPSPWSSPKPSLCGFPIHYTPYIPTSFHPAHVPHPSNFFGFNKLTISLLSINA